MEAFTFWYSKPKQNSLLDEYKKVEEICKTPVSLKIFIITVCWAVEPTQSAQSKHRCLCPKAAVKMCLTGWSNLINTRESYLVTVIDLERTLPCFSVTTGKQEHRHMSELDDCLVPQPMKCR